MSEPGANEINESNESYVDVIIGMDATGSMGGWINAARDTVLQAFTDLRATYPNAHFRLGLVCYRDYGDQERFFIQPLTSDIPTVQNALRNVAAVGGNDTAEDVAGGMHHILAQFREPNPDSADPTRVLLFVADAPPHGARYHSPTVGDRYPKGDPDGRDLFETVRQLAEMGVDMTLFRINASVDKMIEEVASAYNGTDSTFTLLDIAGDQARSSASSSGGGGMKGGMGADIDPFDFRSPVKPGLLSSSAALLSSAASAGSLVSGYIDLASYDSYAGDSCTRSSNVHYMAPSSSASPSEYVRLATCASVSSSVQKRLEKDKKKENKEDESS